MDFKEKIKSLPDTPGIYLMKDSSSRIIYVGKAINIRKRVSSYFRSSAAFPIKTIALVSGIREIEYITASSEKEALILESELIKRFHPRYNVILRDDKTYPCLKLTYSEEFPKLLLVRKKNPVTKTTGKDRYFGPYPDAASLRRTLRILNKIFPLVRCNERAFKIRAKDGNVDRCLDYQLGLCLAPCAGRVSRQEYSALVKDTALFLSGRKEDLIKKLGMEMKAFAEKLQYEKAKVLRERIASINSVTQRVSMRRTSMEELSRIGVKNELLELKEVLGLKKLPVHIEGFDISNISGREAVGSMVYFRDAQPEKSQYRKFKIKTVNSIDDVSMMKEVVRRRYSRAINEGLPLPDLIVIDGGRGQLNGAVTVIKELKLYDVPVMGLAKSEELVYLPDRFGPVYLDRSSSALRLLQRVRDEAHRFALNYHHKLREINTGFRNKKPGKRSL